MKNKTLITSKVLLVSALILSLALTLSGCIIPIPVSVDEDIVAVPEAETTPEDVEEADEEVSVFEEAVGEVSAEANEYYNIGDTISAKSYNFTVQSAEVIESDNMFIQADDGNVYYELTVLFENTSKSDISISSLLNFDAYVDDMAVNMELFSPSEKSSADGTIAPGKKLSGALCYQIPENWSEFELSISNINLFDISGKDDITIVIKNS